MLTLVAILVLLLEYQNITRVGMFNFTMRLMDNFASFSDTYGNFVYVDSFDNREFEVRMGTATVSRIIGTITADSDQELNDKLSELCNK
jgi:hypothetical protein